MKHTHNLLRLLIFICVFALMSSLFGCMNNNKNPDPSTTDTTVSTTEPTESTTETTTPAPQEPIIFTLSFAGDCTLGTSNSTYGTSGSFVKIVDDNYSYPFKNALKYFADDDFTMVNLEGTFTESTNAAEKRFTFRGPSSYSKILTAGSVEAVNLANNHTLDFGKSGYADTKKALKAENIAYVEDQSIAYYETKSGLRIGIYAAQFDLDVSKMTAAIQDLRKNGAELIIASFHWGVEGSYRPTQKQKDHAHAAIDAGADIVFGHHPHVLQPIETYKNGVIYYSLGNFSFGGNRNPRDKDTAIIQQTVIRESDGTVRLAETTIIPFCQSSVSSKNDYQPTPYKETSSKYKRVLSKLDGTFKGDNLVVDYATTPTDPTGGSTEATTTPPSSTQPTVQDSLPTDPTPTPPWNTVPTETTKPTVPEETTSPTETTAPTETIAPPTTTPTLPPAPTKPTPTNPTDETGFIIPI